MALSPSDKAIKSIEKLEKRMDELGKTVKSGTEALRLVNDFIQERDRILRESVTEEDVLDFMERSMLPYGEARKLLEDARAAWPWEGEENDGYQENV